MISKNYIEAPFPFEYCDKKLNRVGVFWTCMFTIISEFGSPLPAILF